MKNLTFTFGRAGERSALRVKSATLALPLRYLYVTLTLLLTLGVENMWGATAIADLNFSYPSTLPSAYTYSSSNTPTIVEVGSKNSVYVANGGGTKVPTFSADNSSAPTDGKRWMAFCPAVNCTVTIAVYSNRKTFYIWDKDHTSTSSYVSTYTNSAQAWESSWTVSLTANTWYVIGGANSQSYVGAMSFVASGGGEEKDYTVTAATSTGTNTYGTVAAGASSLDATETTTITATPATGYKVTNWAVSGTGASISPSGASNSNTTTLTMGTENATVTATFGPKSYTVTLNNQSATTAGTENVTTTYNSNTNLTSAITCPTKTSKVFAGYFTATNGGGVQLIDPAGNWIANAGGGSTYLDGSKNWKYDNNLTLYACWMEYCQGMDMEAYVNDNLSSGNTSKTFTILGTNKFLYNLGGNTEFDNSTDNSYDGLKIKRSGDYLQFLVQANCTLSVTWGYVKTTKPKYSINGGAETEFSITKKSDNQTVNLGAQSYDRFVKIKAMDSDAAVLKKVTITSGGCAATANAGADKATTYNKGVAMAATAATSGYTGAWSIKASSPSTSTSQLSSTSAYNATFTPNAVGTYTLIWTVTDNSDGSCYASDEADVVVSKANISPSLSYSSTTLTVGDNSSSPTVSGNPGSGSVSYAVTSASPEGCITINSNTGVVTAVAAGSGTVTATVAATTNYNGNTCTANFTVNAAAATYTVTYDGSSNDDGTVPEDGTSYSSGATVTVLGNTGSLTRSILGAPATFLGWNTNSDMHSGTHYNPEETFSITSNTTLYAVWGFNITYKDEDKSTEITGLEPTYYIYGEGATLPTTPTKSGYTFAGWYNAWCVDEEDTGASPCGGSAPCGFDDTHCKTTEIKTTDTWDAEYYAKWTEDVVCTDVAAPTSLTCSAHTHNSLTFTWTKAANASGYTASLWDNSSCTGDAVATQDLGDVATVTFSTLSASSTYYCKVQSKGDGSTYCADGGTTSAQSGTTDAAPTLTALTAGTLYQAQDMANITFTGSDQHFTGLSSNHLFHVYGTLNSTDAFGKNKNNSVTDDVDTKNFTSELFITEADNTSSTSDPTKGAIEFITPSTAGILYLYLNSSSSGLSIKKKGSSTSTSLSGAQYKKIDVEASTHYFINGASSARGLYGVKFIALYDITLDKNSGSANGSAKVAPNGKVLLSLSAPTRTGHTVEGYYAESGCTTKIADASGNLQASKDGYTNSSKEWTKGSGATLYAKWTPAVYTVTLDADGGTINSGNVTSYTYGVGATLPVAGDMTAPSGAVFLGWYDGATKVISISTTATGNKSYKAKWGYTLYDSYFYQTYEVSASEVSASTLITNAGFPAYMGTNISANGNTTPSSDITTPHDFSALSSKTYYIKAASSKTVTLSGLADVKTVRFYGNKPSSSRTITTTATLVSGTGSNLTISDKAISGSDKIIEASINISGASGYSSSNYYDYTFTFSNDFYLYGIYVEKYTNVPVTGVSLNKSSTTLTAGDTEQLTATIAPANATNKAVTWTSSNTSAATVSPTGLITAKAAGETTITVTTSDGSYTATCDVTVEAFSCAKFTGKIFELTVTTSSTSYTIGGGTEQSLSSDATIMDDCSAYMGKLGSSTSTSCISSTKLKLDVSSNADKYAKISPKCALRNGDVISCTGSSQQLAFSTTATKVSTPATTSYSYTVTQGDGLAGASTIYVWGASSNATVSTLTITRPTSYVLTYNVNGGRAETAPDADRFAAGANELTTDRPVRSGYVLKGWTEDAEGEETLYRPGAVYTMPSSAQTLYAQWKTPEIDDAYASDELSSKTTSNSVNCTALINGLGNNSAPYKLSNSGSYYGITLARGNFKVGDVVTFKIKRSSGSTATIYREAAGTNQVYQLSGISSSGDINVEFTVTQAMLDAGLTNTVVMARTGSDTQNHEMYWIKVKRNYCDGCMAPKTGVTTWSSTASDWIGQDGVAEDVPTSDDVVFIDKAIIVGDGVTAQAAEVIIGESGSITISPTGGLIVEGGIRQSGDVATDASDIVINTSASGQGLLIFDNPSAGNQATINMYSKANKADPTRNWQYMAIPIQEASVSDFFYGVGTYTYKHIEAQGGWVRYGLGTTLNAFDGIGLTQEEVTNYTFYGTLVSTANHTYSVTKVNKGNNIVGNSWPAPINLKALREDDFTNVELDIAIYNTGSDNKSAWTTGTSTEAGTWDHVPLSLVGGVFANDWAGTTVIPAFQAFQLKATGAGSVTIDYDRCVRNVADGHANDALRAPSRRGTNSDDKQLLRLAVQDTIGIDYIYLIEGSEFTEGYDNGWEAAYSKGIRFGKLYALDAEANKKMALARPDLEGTMVGFVPGVSNTYTITFNQTEGYYYLNDLKKEESTLIQKGNSYTFTIEEGDAAERFMISGTPFAKTNPTGVDKVQGDKVQSDKVRKVLIDDHLYIIRAGKIFDATGGRIK